MSLNLKPVEVKELIARYESELRKISFQRQMISNAITELEDMSGLSDSLKKVLLSLTVVVENLNESIVELRKRLNLLKNILTNIFLKTIFSDHFTPRKIKYIILEYLDIIASYKDFKVLIRIFNPIQKQLKFLTSEQQSFSRYITITSQIKR